LPEPTFTVVIPYRERLDNVRTLLESLAAQSMARSRFDVVVGALEYATDYVEMCRTFADRLEVMTVMAGGEWNVCRARNLGLRQATGDIVVLLDADMVVPPDFLERLAERYFAAGEEVCVIGQMIDPHLAMTDDVAEPPPSTYADFRADLAGLDGISGDRLDPRLAVFEAGPALPWTLVWTAVVALPMAVVRRHHLFFDEEFRGWGPEDQEWGYRISRAGIPIVVAADLYAVHQPHRRDARRNLATHRANSKHFLRAWPDPDVELALALGSLSSNRRYAEFTAEVAAIAGHGKGLGLVLSTVAGRRRLTVGLVLERDGQISAAGGRAGADEVLPLSGLMVPYADDSIDEAVLLPTVLRFSQRFRDRIQAEAERVARTVHHGLPATDLSQVSTS
jgi:hypothetical protein